MYPLRASPTRRRHHRSVVAGAAALPLLVGAGDPGSSRLVYAMVIGLVVVGIAFVVLAVWLIRQTRYDLPVLAPLERMGDKDWRRQSDPATQRRILDEVRPDGARPLHSESSPPSIDAEFELAERPVTSMSDLAPPVAEARSATPHGLERPDLLDLGSDGSSDAAEEESTDHADAEESTDHAEEESTDDAEGEPADVAQVEESSPEEESSTAGPDDAAEEPSVEDPPVGESADEPTEEPIDGAVQGSTGAAER